MTRIEELRERVASSDAWWFENGSVVYKVNAACELVSLLEADLKEAMEALEPFAKIANMPLSNTHGFTALNTVSENALKSSYRWHRCDVEAEHARRAAAALAKHKDSTHDT